MTDILQLDNVTKAYGNYLAVNKVSFSVPRGSIFGLLGPNGAGKTSIIRIITTITKADEGKVIFDGEKLNSSHPERIGYMPEERGLYKRMKVGEHLLYLAQLKGLSAVDARKEIGHWLEKFEIKDWWNKKVQDLSKGMQQKVQFIATIVHRPKLLILDEPFSGLDPLNTTLIKNEIRTLNQNGTTIIFSTHRMEQVDEICDNIALINKGLNVLEGSVKDIKEKYKENLFRITFKGDMRGSLSSEYSIVERIPNGIVIGLLDSNLSNRLIRELIDQGLIIESFQEILPGINEIFIQKVKETFGET